PNCPLTPSLPSLSLHDALPISTPQTVTIIFEASLEALFNFSRKRLTCVSTVRKSPKNSYCHTSFNNSSRVKTLSGVFARKHNNSYSLGVKRSEEHTSELQSRFDLVCRLLLEKKK